MNRNSKWSPDVYDYQVGWICKSEADYGAACQVLDEEYKPPTTRHRSTVYYKHGRIGEHHVVINTPISGSSTRSLPDMARNMNEQFPSVRFFLVVGSDGTTNTTGALIGLGDVVIGTNVVPCDTVDNQENGPVDKAPRPPEYLLSALTVLFGEKSFDGLRLQQAMDEVINRIPNYKGRYQRPGDAPMHLTQEQATPHQNSSQYHRDVQPQEPQQDGSIAVYRGNIASESATEGMSISRSQEQITLTDDVLCVDTGCVDMLAAEFHCLPILGMSSDARGHSHSHRDSHWSHYAALAAAVCSKEVLVSVRTDIVAQAPSNMSPTDLGIMMEESMRGLEQTIQRTGRGQSDNVSNEVQAASRRIDEFQYWICNLPVSGQQRAQQRVEDVHAQIKKTEETMREDLNRMAEQIDKLKDDSPNAQMRADLDILKQTVDDHSSKLDKLSELTNDAFNLAAGVLDKVGHETDNPEVRKAAEWFELTRGFRDKWNLGSVFPRRSKSTEKPPPRAPKSGDDSPVPEDKSKTNRVREKIQRRGNHLGSKSIPPMKLGWFGSHSPSATSSSDTPVSNSDNCSSSATSGSPMQYENNPGPPTELDPPSTQINSRPEVDNPNANRPRFITPGPPHHVSQPRVPSTDATDSHWPSTQINSQPEIDNPNANRPHFITPGPPHHVSQPCVPSTDESGVDTSNVSYSKAFSIFQGKSGLEGPSH